MATQAPATDQRPPAQRRPRRPRGRPSAFAAIHRRHPFWGPVIWLLDRIWHFIGWLWGLLVIGGLAVNPVISYLTTGNFGPDPRQWFVTRLVEVNWTHTAIAFAALVGVTVLAGLGHRLAHPPAAATSRAASRLPHVRDLDPGAYVPKYVADVYLPRRDATSGADFTAEARAALQAAARRPDPRDPGASLGVCVYGRTMLGKTRLAWETLAPTLPAWRFIKWPHGSGADPLDWGAIAGENIVLWLDDAQEYANPNEGPAVSDLPRRFAEAGARLVVVATCRDGDDADAARRYLGALLDRLTPITLADITAADAATLERQLSAEGQQVEADQFDGTPGSVLLGVERMRTQIYPALSDDAKRLLRTMKLLRSARTYTYPARRLRGVATPVFGLPETTAAYTTAADALVTAHFVRRGALDADGLPALDPVADAYLERAIPDFPPSGVPIATSWPQLQAALEALRDADALVSLGSAFQELRIGLDPTAPHDLRPNKARAVACARAALAIYPSGSSDWAMTQNNLGNALSNQAGLAEGQARAGLLAEAVAAYRAALTVRTREAAPAAWAATQNNLATALGAQAGLAEGEARAGLLAEAVAAYRAALTVSTREAAPADWAMTQFNLAILYADMASDATTPAERLRLLRDALAAAQGARDVYAGFSPVDFQDAARLCAAIEAAISEEAGG